MTCVTRDLFFTIAKQPLKNDDLGTATHLFHSWENQPCEWRVGISGPVQPPGSGKGAGQSPVASGLVTHACVTISMKTLNGRALRASGTVKTCPCREGGVPQLCGDRSPCPWDCSGPRPARLFLWLCVRVLNRVLSNKP